MANNIQVIPISEKAKWEDISGRDYVVRYFLIDDELLAIEYSPERESQFILPHLPDEIADRSKYLVAERIGYLDGQLSGNRRDVSFDFSICGSNGCISLKGLSFLGFVPGSYFPKPDLVVEIVHKNDAVLNALIVDWEGLVTSACEFLSVSQTGSGVRIQATGESAALAYTAFFCFLYVRRRKMKLKSVEIAASEA